MGHDDIFGFDAPAVLLLKGSAGSFLFRGF
jgi:hypothetical protein